MTDQLNFDEYQKLADDTAVYPGRDDEKVAPYPALGLAGEAGEVCEHLKKLIRDDDGRLSDERRRALKKELGDVLWYVAAVATELDASLAEIAAANVDKLADRRDRGVLKGEGDDR